jgi:phosphohistidine phosphatase
MLRLTLVRHGKAEPQQAGQEDWDRVLDTVGHREAVQMGQRLQHRQLQPTSIASSNAPRAMSTAQLLARELGFPAKAIRADQQLYLISAGDLLQWICTQQDIGNAEHPTQHLMIVAHNPGLSEFAARIALNPSVDNLPTCACYTLRFDIEHWHELTWGLGQNGELEMP